MSVRSNWGLLHPRVDYGDLIKDFVPVIFNKTDKNVNLLFTMYVFSGDRKILDLERKTLSVVSHSQQPLEGDYEIDIEKKQFQEPGEYKLRLTITDASKKKLDEVTRRFWVEMDPKLRAPFEIKSYRVDGNNVLRVFDRAVKAVELCRSGKGSVLIECLTYRFRGHVGPDDNIQGKGCIYPYEFSTTGPTDRA